MKCPAMVVSEDDERMSAVPNAVMIRIAIIATSIASPCSRARPFIPAPGSSFAATRETGSPDPAPID